MLVAEQMNYVYFVYSRKRKTMHVSYVDIPSDKLLVGNIFSCRKPGSQQPNCVKHCFSEPRLHSSRLSPYFKVKTIGYVSDIAWLFI